MFDAYTRLPELAPFPVLQQSVYASPSHSAMFRHGAIPNMRWLTVLSTYWGMVSQNYGLAFHMHLSKPDPRRYYPAGSRDHGCGIDGHKFTGIDGTAFRVR